MGEVRKFEKCNRFSERIQERNKRKINIMNGKEKEKQRVVEIELNLDIKELKKSKLLEKLKKLERNFFIFLFFLI